MIFLCVGCKTGDLIATLPILNHHFSTTGQKPKVMVAKQYAALFDRVPFATPVVFDGDWQDLKGAMMQAKRMDSEIVCLSTYGRDFPIQHKCSSFQLDCYERAGLLSQWDSLPLPLNAKESTRYKQPTILYADHAESAPFMQKDELYALLKQSFPKHDIVRLSAYKLKHFFDFLPWYNAADALVTIDTAHLHLSAASIKPVATLAADKPSRWKGSAWSKRFCFYCRYSEFMWRKEELVDCLKAAMEKKHGVEIVRLN